MAKAPKESVKFICYHVSVIMAPAGLGSGEGNNLVGQMEKDRADLISGHWVLLQHVSSSEAQGSCQSTEAANAKAWDQGSGHR